MPNAVATTILHGLTPGAAGKAASAEGATAGLFARLVAAIAGVVRPTQAAAPEGVVVPGSDPKASAEALAALAGAVQGVLTAAASKLEALEQGPQAGTGETAEAVQAVLKQAAEDVAALFVQFDAATGANTVAVVRVLAAALAEAPAVPPAAGAAPGVVVRTAPSPVAADVAGPTPAEGRATLAAVARGIVSVLQIRPVEGAVVATPETPEVEGEAVPPRPAVTVAVPAANAPAAHAAAPVLPAAAEAPERRVELPPGLARVEVSVVRVAEVAPLAAPKVVAKAGRAPVAAPAAAVPAFVAELSAALDRSAPAAQPIPVEVRPPVLLQHAPPVTAAPPAPAQHPVPGLAREVLHQVKGRSFEEGTTRIELSPRGLGDLEIELSPGEAGRLRVVVRADNPAVLAALRGDRDTLLGLLRDGGSPVADNTLSFEGFGARQGGGRQGREAGEDFGFGRIEASEEPEIIQPQRRVVQGRIDILT